MVSTNTLWGGVAAAFVVGSVVGVLGAGALPPAGDRTRTADESTTSPPDGSEASTPASTSDGGSDNRVADLERENATLRAHIGTVERELASATERANDSGSADGSGTPMAGGGNPEVEPEAAPTEMTAEEAFKALQQAIADGESLRGNDRLLAALRRHGAELAEPLRTMFANADNAVERAGILGALAALGRTENLDIFRDVLTAEGENAVLRRTAMSGLIAAPDESSLPLLRDLVRTDNDMLTQSMAGTAIGAIEGSGASEELQAAFEDTDKPMVKAFLLRSLVDRAERDRASFFEAVARDGDERQDFRTSAVEGLEKSLGRDALPALEELARTVEDDFVRDAARRAAERLRGE